jgi:threonine/homoserine/homoserine lactone efflux protein
VIETLTLIDGWTAALFLAATVVLMLTPGPGMMFCVACGLTGGARAGIAAGCGTAAGLLVQTALAAGGLSALLLATPQLYDAVRWVGAAYLAYLAWTTWRHAGAPDRKRGRRSIRRAFGRAFVTNILNPKVVLFMLAFLPQFADPAIGPVWRQVVIFGLAAAVIGLLFDCLYGGLAGLLGDRLRRASGVMSKISAIVFGGLAARLAID